MGQKRGQKFRNKNKPLIFSGLSVLKVIRLESTFFKFSLA